MSNTSASFGFKDVDASQKAGLVRGVFDRVAKNYDIMNDLMSGGVHRLWKDAVAARLKDFEIVCIMRERTPFPRTLLEKLPRLKLLVTSGLRNAAIDVAACRDRGVVVAGSESLGYPTAELTWGLILGFMRSIPQEDRITRAGGWQTTLGIGCRGKTLGVIGLGRLGRQVAAVVNFPSKQIGPVMSEILVLGFPDEAGEVVLVSVTHKVPNGGKLF